MLLFALCEHEGEAEDIRTRGLSMIQWGFEFSLERLQKVQQQAPWNVPYRVVPIGIEAL